MSMCSPECVPGCLSSPHLASPALPRFTCRTTLHLPHLHLLLFVFSGIVSYGVPGVVWVVVWCAWCGVSGGVVCLVCCEWQCGVSECGVSDSASGGVMKWWLFGLSDNMSGGHVVWVTVARVGVLNWWWCGVVWGLLWSWVWLVRETGWGRLRPGEVRTTTPPQPHSYTTSPNVFSQLDANSWTKPDNCATSTAYRLKQKNNSWEQTT